ncbi:MULTISPECIES: glycosyltransferase [Pectobacterium]|uniref:glycosyltransferase n=1 Tax=Pectobacterium TaxID=122277 RepID=UPI001CF23986|nr:MULTISPECIES: glycosyltransferase [Pectobacterium]MCA6975823.1 glycosyltransferase [Pectobacterium carotovorum]UMO88803.1 glycosyltransferase [Pectobacterium sp. PL64]
MTRKILFATHNNADESDGVWKKISSQVSALRSMGASVDFFYMDDSIMVHDDGFTLKKIESRYKCKYFFYYDLKNYIKKENKKFDLAYIRKPHGGLFVVFLANLLAFMKKMATKIVIEVPTYPYKKEFKSYKEKSLDFIFDLSLFFFKKYIDEVTYMGDFTAEIWGVKSRRIANGIDIKSIKPIKEKKRKKEEEFIIVGVAKLEAWHGYDRLIEGLYHYRGNIQVLFNIIGYSPLEYDRLKSMVTKYSLEENVIFHGKKFGKDLDMLLENADVCVDAVARHRSGNNTNSSIKSKEYTARGLPFIKSHVDYSFGNEEFILQVMADDKYIDINELIKWRDSLPSDFSKNEIDFAKKNLTWSKQLQFLLEVK